MGDLWLTTRHFVTLGGALNSGLSHDKIFHLFLKLGVNSFLVLHLFRVHIHLLRLDRQLLAESASV